jgi:hypothetical protein
MQLAAQVIALEASVSSVLARIAQAEGEYERLEHRIQLREAKRGTVLILPRDKAQVCCPR